MKRHFLSAVCVGLLIVGAASSAWAWNFGGHMVSGSFAYDVLQKENPETLAKVLEILKQHPEFEKRWAKKLDQLDPDMRDRAILMYARDGPMMSAALNTIIPSGTISIIPTSRLDNRRRSRVSIRPIPIF